MRSGPKPTDRVWETDHGVKMRMPTDRYPYFRLDYNLGGKRHQRSAGTDWQSAWAEAGRLDALVAAHAGAGTQQQFAHLAEAWFERKSRDWSVSYKASTRRYLDKHVLPEVGHLILSDLQLVDLEDLMDQLPTVEVKKKVRVLLSSLLHWGQRRKWLAVPASDLLPDRPSSEGSGVQRVTMDEVPAEADVEALFHALAAPRTHQTKRGLRTYTPPEWVPYMALIAAYGGLRIGEIVALRGRHVSDDTVLVERQIVVVQGQLHETPPKSNSVRTVVITRRALTGEVDLASWIQKRAEEVGPDGLIFPSPKGEVWRPGNFRRQHFDKARELAWNNQHWTFHSLRHFAATRALQLKLAPQDVQALLGHQSVRTTLDTYVGHQAEALERMRGTL